MKNRIIASVLLITFVLGIIEMDTEASQPYTSYNYDYWENIVFTPEPYFSEETVTGQELGIGGFATPNDFCVAPNGDLYIADTGNNRIVVINGKTKKISKIIDGFERAGEKDFFNTPYGVCVSENEKIYIADKENKRIVVLDLDGSFIEIIDNPVSDVLTDDFVFKPLKITVDYADRVYCIAQNMFEGIMVFETNGEFSGFFGTINVSLSFAEKFWKKIATKEERKNQTLYIATEFTGIDVDSGGFIYATNIDEVGKQGVRRLNPSGQDVIKKGWNENLNGDLQIGGATEFAGPSQITDVVYRDMGIYSLLDRKRGRIFTYDHEGNLLYVFGGLGKQEGTFVTPVAIEQWGESLIILDATRAEIYVFEPTEYGRLINEAVGLRFDGDEELAVPLWKRVIALDEYNELANTGIGKAYLSAGENELAMEYLLRGMNRSYYSIAFKRYRNAFLKDQLGLILTLLFIFIIGIKIFGVVRRKKKGIAKKGDILNE